MPPAEAAHGLPCAPEDIDSFLGEPTPAAAAVLARAPGRVLVLGAGGKMGLHLSVMLRRALAPLGRADDVLAVSRFRTLRDREDFTRLGVATLAADLEDGAHRRFGEPSTSVDQMQRWIAAWLLAGGGDWGKPTGFERRDGNF